jgi:TRAP-type C4-dicarboxylate transport system permease small subunit
MRDLYARWMARLYLLCIWVAGLSMLVMTLIVPWGVYTRYVLGTGSEWPEPMAILLMVVFTFSGAAACYRANAHIAVVLFVDMLPAPAQRLAGWLVDVLLALLSLFMVIWGIELVYTTWFQVIAEFPWLRAGITYMPLPIGGFITLLFILERMWCGPPQDLAAAS